MAVVFDDTFTEAGDTTLASHVPDTGTGWTDESATGSTWEITASSDDVSPDSNANNTLLFYSAQHSNGTNVEYDIEVDVVTEGTGNTHPCGFYGRFVDASNTYRVFWYNRAPTDLFLYKFVGGTPTALASADTDNTWTASRIKFEILDATKRLFFGATQEISSTDNALTAQGEGGLAAGAIVSASDDISANWTFDNFTITEPDAAAFTGQGRLVSDERNRLVRAC